VVPTHGDAVDNSVNLSVLPTQPDHASTRTESTACRRPSDYLPTTVPLSRTFSPARMLHLHPLPRHHLCLPASPDPSAHRQLPQLERPCEHQDGSICPTHQREGSWTSKSSPSLTNLAYPRPNRASGERSRPGLDGRHGHGRRREGTGEIRVEDSAGSSPRSHYKSSCCRFGFPMPPNPGRQAMVPVNRWRRRGVQGTGRGRRTAASSM
jgi:hypothetical protein